MARRVRSSAHKCMILIRQGRDFVFFTSNNRWCYKSSCPARPALPSCRMQAWTCPRSRRTETSKRRSCAPAITSSLILTRAYNTLTFETQKQPAADLDSGRIAVAPEGPELPYGRALAQEADRRLRCMHRNPVKRGLVQSPEQWRWSSYSFYLLDEVGPVRVNVGWTEISFRASCGVKEKSKTLAAGVRNSRPCKKGKDGAPRSMALTARSKPGPPVQTV
jgi:hypothetical protein